LKQKYTSLHHACFCGVSLHLVVSFQPDPDQRSPLELFLPAPTEGLGESPPPVQMKMKQVPPTKLRQQLETSHATIPDLLRKLRRIKRLCGVSKTLVPPQSEPLHLAGPNPSTLKPTSKGIAELIARDLSTKQAPSVALRQQLKAPDAAITELTQEQRRIKRIATTYRKLSK